MKSKKLPQKKSAEFDSNEKAKKAGLKEPKQKRAKKPSIYDDDEMEDLILSDQDFGGFNDYDDDDDFY